MAIPSHSPGPASHQIFPILPHNVRVLWLLPGTQPQTFTTRGPLGQPPLRPLVFKSDSCYSQDPTEYRNTVLLLPCTIPFIGSLLPPEVVFKLFKASQPFLQDKILLRSKSTMSVVESGLGT